MQNARKLVDIEFANARAGWVTDFGGDIHETTDGGRTWRSVFRHDRVTSAIHRSPERMIVAGGGGLIVRRQP